MATGFQCSELTMDHYQWNHHIKRMTRTIIIIYHLQLVKHRSYGYCLLDFSKADTIKDKCKKIPQINVI